MRAAGIYYARPLPELKKTLILEAFRLSRSLLDDVVHYILPELGPVIFQVFGMIARDAFIRDGH